MSDSQSDIAKTDQGGRALSVYAAAAGVASAIPLPFLDAALGDLARGSGIRRVASINGVQLSVAARRVLGKPLIIDAGKTGQLLASIGRRVFAPFRIASRTEDALSALVSASLFDHYLRNLRLRDDEVSANEAESLRSAMRSAAAEAVKGHAGGAPSALFDTLSQVAKSVVPDDADERSVMERIVDTTLDSAADARGFVSKEIKLEFERQLVMRGLAQTP